MFKKERRATEHSASGGVEQISLALPLPMEIGREKVGLNVSVHASDNNNSWTFEARKRLVTDSIQPRIKRGLQRLALFQHKAFLRIAGRTLVAVSAGALAAWTVSTVTGLTIITTIATGGAIICIAGSVYAAGSLAVRVMNAVNRHGIRVDETTRNRLDEINREQENSR